LLLGSLAKLEQQGVTDAEICIFFHVGIQQFIDYFEDILFAKSKTLPQHPYSDTVGPKKHAKNDSVAELGAVERKIQY